MSESPSHKRRRGIKVVVKVRGCLVPMTKLEAAEWFAKRAARIDQARRLAAIRCAKCHLLGCDNDCRFV